MRYQEPTADLALLGSLGFILVIVGAFFFLLLFDDDAADRVA
jgi:hypothetical protein